MLGVICRRPFFKVISASFFQFVLMDNLSERQKTRRCNKAQEIHCNPPGNHPRRPFMRKHPPYTHHPLEKQQFVVCITQTKIYELIQNILCGYN